MFWLKSGKILHNIDSPPLSVFQQLVSKQVLQENSLTIGRMIMEYAKIGVPQFDGRTTPSIAEG
jgi:hypothetical protein